MALFSNIYSRALNSSRILLLTDFPRRKNKSWIYYQLLLLFKTRPNNKDIKKGAGWLIIFINLL